jgi:hypothetical protein
MQKVFVKIEDKKWKDYEVDDTYYLKAIQREIDNIEGDTKQLSLF